MLWSGGKNKNRHIKQNKKAIFKIAFFKILTIGGPGGVRTPDPTLRRNLRQFPSKHYLVLYKSANHSKNQ